jgi:hypothetical protein
MLRNLRNMIHRMSPSEQDIRTLWGALDLLAKGGKQPGSKQKPLPSPEPPVTDA